VHRPLRVSQLSPPRQFLIRVCESMNYGRTQDLAIRDVEAVDERLDASVQLDVQSSGQGQPARWGEWE